MHQPVDERGHDHHVAEEFRPVVEPAIGGDEGRGFLMPAHEYVGQLVGGAGREFAQEEVVDDQQLGGTQLRAQLAYRAQFAGLVCWAGTGCVATAYDTRHTRWSCRDRYIT